jgi:aspartate/methionine/tyrosine aminotransferase
MPAPSADLAIHVLDELERFGERTRGIYEAGYPILAEWAASRGDVGWYGNDGALFSYFRLPEGVEADAFCERLRRDYDTQVVSGTFFGQMGHFRIGFGVPAEDLAEGLRRVGLALDDVCAERGAGRS